MGAPTPICLRRCHYHLHNDLTVAPHGILYDIFLLYARGWFAVFPTCLCCIRKIISSTLCRLCPAQRFCFSPVPGGAKAPPENPGEKYRLGGKNVTKNRLVQICVLFLEPPRK